MTSNEIQIEEKTSIEESNNETLPKVPSKYSFMVSTFGNFCGNCSAFSKTTDTILGILSIGQFGFGIATWFTGDKITSVGCISAAIFSGTTLSTVRKMRLQASMQQSVNVLQEENEELKESNEELKENIDDLESVSDKLSADLKLLKETVGLLDENADEVIENLREVYEGIKKENEIHSKLNKNMIYLNILQIIRHYDSNSNFSLKVEDLQKAKKTLLNAFPNLDYNSLLKKINDTQSINKVTKITAKMIFDSIKAPKN
jgi:cell division protein FtsB